MAWSHSEIGHGAGVFLEALAAARPAGRYVGFDPHGATASHRQNVEFRRALFCPEEHVAALQPDLLISRHVLEHLTDPLGFVQSLSFAASMAALRQSTPAWSRRWRAAPTRSRTAVG